MTGMPSWCKRMPKFFFDAKKTIGTHVELTGKTAHHIANVLRYKLGDEVLLCDGNCIDYVTKFVSCETSKKLTKIRLEVKEARKCYNEPSVYIRLYQSVIKWENFDFVIQKSVEIGVSEIVPVVTKRSIHGISDVRKKVERFNRITKSAAEQSMRGIVPNVLEPVSMSDYVLQATTTACDKVSFLALCDERITLMKRLENTNLEVIDLWIGPEGGFTTEETTSLVGNGFIPYSLGPRVLRSETAGIVSAANVILLSQR